MLMVFEVSFFLDLGLEDNLMWFKGLICRKIYIIKKLL